ncbi:hypothetical protein BJ165DRAFT_1358263 [Panaeolus papilionaceus]|nr:hypothetical protein BJ165DRAFT_1358263 [Panaeolus papilionaceus]
MFLPAQLAAVGALNLCAYNTSSCDEIMACCYNVAEGACCAYPPTYKWTACQDMPLTSDGSGTTHGITARDFPSRSEHLSVSDPICVPIHDRHTSLHESSSSGRRPNIRSHALRRRSSNKGTKGNCVKPNVIGFTTDDGVKHRHYIDEIGFEQAERYLKEKNYEALFNLPKAGDHAGH